MHNLQVIDNFLDSDSFAKISSFLMSCYFPWYYKDSVIGGDTSKHYQFTHNFYGEFTYRPCSDYFQYVTPVINSLTPYAIVRIKANLLPRTERHIEHGYHIDVQDSKKHLIKTAILYVNTNNGYTKFEDGTKIESVANRMVIFDSAYRHTGSTCTDQKSRVVINFNYYP